MFIHCFPKYFEGLGMSVIVENGQVVVATTLLCKPWFRLSFPQTNPMIAWWQWKWQEECKTCVLPTGFADLCVTYRFCSLLSNQRQAFCPWSAVMIPWRSEKDLGISVIDGQSFLLVTRVSEGTISRSPIRQMVSHDWIPRHLWHSRCGLKPAIGGRCLKDKIPMFCSFHISPYLEWCDPHWHRFSGGPNN